jgi:hypothetical protein
MTPTQLDVPWSKIVRLNIEHFSHLRSLASMFTTFGVGGANETNSQGKVGELLFSEYLTNIQVPYIAPCLSVTHVGDEPFDFVVKSWTINVKCAVLRYSMQEVYNWDNYGMQVNYEEVSRPEGRAEIYVWVLVPDTYDCAYIMGGCSADEVLRSSTRSVWNKHARRQDVVYTVHAKHLVPVPELLGKVRK